MSRISTVNQSTVCSFRLLSSPAAITTNDEISRRLNHLTLSALLCRMLASLVTWARSRSCLAGKYCALGLNPLLVEAVAASRHLTRIPKACHSV